MHRKSSTKAPLSAFTALFALLCSCGTGAASTEAVSSVLTAPHPDDPSKQVEYFLEKPQGPGPWPTVVLLHGYQKAPSPGGKDFADWGVLKGLASRGYLAVAVSQPGFGHSSGPPDFCGPFTQHAVSGVIARLRDVHQSAPGKLVLEGISRGALTAGLIAAHDASVSGVILISGVYDLRAYVKDPQASPGKQSVIQDLIAETGGTDEALGLRSILPVADGITARALVMNGAKDDLTDPAQARSFVEAVTRNGGTARVIIYPEFGHKIPVEARIQDVDAFIDGVLGPGRAN
jgi:dipeptidyl aminopeptidase/acylaminoacyl peptidase